MEHNEQTCLEYLESLPNDEAYINLTNYKLTELPDLSRFINLQWLNCSDNQLTNINLNSTTLSALVCCDNNIKNISVNNLPNLRSLYCSNNQLTFLPQMPNLESLICQYNQLYFLPELQNIEQLSCEGNPIYMCNRNDDIDQENEDEIDNLRIMNRFRDLYYSLKFKKQFHNWLWEGVRKPKIEQIYHPSNLIKMINDNPENWVEVVESWN
jgi:hypothetical protein